MLFDVVIVGSGPAACAAGVALASHYSVAMLHRGPRKSPAANGEHLAPSGAATLRRLGLGGLLEPHRRSPGILSYWTGARTPLAHSYLLSPHGFAWNLDRCRFDADLRTAAAASGAIFVQMQRLRRPVHSDGTWHVAIESGQRTSIVRGKVLIDATGRVACVARKLGVRPVRVDRLVAVTARIDGASCADSRLTIEACRDGWWYTVPLASGALFVAFLTDSDFVPASRPQRLRRWLTILNSTVATRERVGAFEVTEPHLSVAPAGTQFLAVRSSENWLAIGDASQARDPLSGAGLSAALADAERCPAVVASALTEHRSLETTMEISERRRASLRRHLSELNNYYRSEHRWPEAEFWRRRTTAAPKTFEQACHTCT